MTYLAEKITPPDILAFGYPWTQRTSEIWTTPDFRAPIIAFLRAFIRPPRNWATSPSVEEHILSGANIDCPLPKTPDWPSDVPDPIRQGLASLVFHMTDVLNGKVYDFGIPYIDRLDTSADAVQAGLVVMGNAFDIAARRAR